MGRAIRISIGSATSPGLEATGVSDNYLERVGHAFRYVAPGPGDDAFDLTPRYSSDDGTLVGEPDLHKFRTYDPARLAAGFARAGLRSEVWPVPPWAGLVRHRVIPPAPQDTSDVAEFAFRFTRSVGSAVGSAATVAITVSGGLDSAVVLQTAAKWCRANDRRLIAVTLDIIDDDGGSPASGAQRLIDALGIQAELHVVAAEPRRWPEPQWCWHGPRFDAWPRYRRGITETAQAAGAEVLLHGTGADELLTVPPHLLGPLVRARGWKAGRSYLQERRRWGVTEVEQLLPFMLPGLQTARRRRAYWQLTWPGLVLDAGPQTLTSEMRALAARCAEAHRVEALRATIGPGQLSWAQAAAMHTMFPRDLLTPAGDIPERFPFLDKDFAAYAYHIPLAARFGTRHRTAYLNSKTLVADLLPPEAIAVLPQWRLRAYTAYQRYWSQQPDDATEAIDCGLVDPDWSSRCHDAFDRALVLSLQAWLIGATAYGAKFEGKP